MTDLYPEEVLDPDIDDGTMPANVASLAEHVVGHRIVSVAKETVWDDDTYYHYNREATVITLDNGKRVALFDDGDCCAYTELQAFLLHPESVDHMIMGVGTTDGYTTWHVVADFGDILTLTVGWSCGNPFYYSYGFTIRVLEDPSS